MRLAEVKTIPAIFPAQTFAPGVGGGMVLTIASWLTAQPSRVIRPRVVACTLRKADGAHSAPMTGALPSRDARPPPLLPHRHDTTDL
jgi:hypothetical protein